jgi:hypothetical protein
MLYNGFSISRDYDNDFLQYADGGLTEGFVHTSGQLPHENFDASKWKTIVDHLQNISDSKKKIYLAQTTTLIDASTTDGELQKLALYAFTSFLLGKGDYAYFAFHAVPSDTYDYFYFDYWGTDIGAPLENYHERGTAGCATIYEREFENVLVLVNPGDSSSTVNLGAPFRTLSGGTVNSVTLEPKSGTILYKADSDADGTPNNEDNCPNKPNGPSLGSCILTSDKPGINCISSWDCVIGCSSNGFCSKNQEDTDGDGIGDVCEEDLDGDGIVNEDDNCPNKPNGYELGSCSPWSGSPGVQCESDNDCTASCTGVQACNKNQEDSDNDGDGDVCDNCPNNCNSFQNDADADRVGDVCDTTPGCGGCSGVACEQQC